jgi:LPXTG-motif cell wall-anchored protein
MVCILKLQSSYNFLPEEDTDKFFIKISSTGIFIIAIVIVVIILSFILLRKRKK